MFGGIADGGDGDGDCGGGEGVWVARGPTGGCDGCGGEGGHQQRGGRVAPLGCTRPPHATTRHRARRRLADPLSCTVLVLPPVRGFVRVNSVPVCARVSRLPCVSRLRPGSHCHLYLWYCFLLFTGHSPK